MVKLHLRVASELDDLHYQAAYDVEEVRHLIREGEKLEHSGYDCYPVAMEGHCVKIIWSKKLEHFNISYASLKIPLTVMRELGGAGWLGIKEAQEQMHATLHKIAHTKIKTGGAS